MKRVLSILALFMPFNFVIIANGQSLEDAKTYMAEAERAFANGRLNDALQGVRQTEQALGKLSPNVLFLKVGILDMLVRSDMGHIQELGRALEDFFRIIDAKKYPADKLTVMLEADARHKELESGERNAFTALTPSSTITEMQTFLARYPGSRHTADVKGMIRQAVDMKQQVETELWLAQNQVKYRKYRKLGSTMTPIGAILAPAGLGMLVSSLAYGLQPQSPDEVFDPNLGWVKVEPFPKKEVTFGLLGGGLAAGIAGGIILGRGLYCRHKSKKLKRQADSRGVQFSMYPTFDPLSGTATAQVSIKF